MRMWLSNAKSQMIFGEREVKIEVTIRDAEEIARRTQGRVYWNSEGKLDYKNNYYTVERMIESGIREKATEKVETQKIKEVIVSTEELKWKDIEEEMKRCEDKEKEEIEEKKREKQVKSMLEKRFPHIKAVLYSSNVTFKIDNERIHEIYYNKYSELIERLNELSEEELLLMYIQDIKKKYKDLKKQCEQKEEEIIKRYYNEEKEITIEQPEQVTLRVTAEYPDDY